MARISTALLALLLVSCEGTKAHRAYFGYDRDLPVESSPSGIEIYSSTQMGEMKCWGTTPVMLTRAVGPMTIAAYRDGRVLWLDVNAREMERVNFAFTEETSRPATKLDYRKLGRKAEFEALLMAEDRAEAETQVRDAELLVRDFRRELAVLPDAAGRMKRIARFYGQLFKFAGSVLSTYEEGLQRGEEGLAEARVRLGARGILAAIDLLTAAAREAVLSVKDVPADLLDFYALYSEAYALVRNPAGPLDAFRQRKRDLDLRAKELASKLEVAAK